MSFRSLFLVAFSCVALVSAVQAAAPFRLYHLAVTRFTAMADGRAQLELGHLNTLEQVRVTETHVVAMPPQMPAAALGKLLVSSEAWFAYQALGPAALENFERLNQGVPFVVAGIPHYEVGVKEDAVTTDGRVVNLSTRGVAAPGTTPSLIGGFVVEGQGRRVLVRAIGPSLAQFGVSGVMPDPFLFIQRGSLTFHFNDDWNQRPDADEIAQTAAAVGAFPLARSSKDAVLLVELPPGAYTASIVSATGGAGGEALLEIYILP